jgi:hypothetical protein
MKRLACAFLALAGLAACGPTSYVTTVTVRATEAVARAREAGAEQAAPYEYVSAVEYLHKAREVGGHARYEAAVRYGRRAIEMAEQARAVAIERGGRPQP